MEHPFARSFVHRAEVASTSDLALDLLRAGEDRLPLVVLADRQTSGRGRGDLRWWSDAGSLTFTVGLDPARLALRDDHAARLALTMAVAVVDALERIIAPGLIGIRWPNDVESAGKKLGGILPERVETTQGVRVALGVGLNLATRIEAAPAEVRAMATTVEALTGTPVDRLGLLRSILDRLEPRLAALAADDPKLAERWAALDTLQETAVRVDLGGGRIVAGIAAGIDRRGALRLDSGKGPAPLYGGRVLRDAPRGS